MNFYDIFTSRYLSERLYEELNINDDTDFYEEDCEVSNWWNLIDNDREWSIISTYDLNSTKSTYRYPAYTFEELLDMTDYSFKSISELIDLHINSEGNAANVLAKLMLDDYD
jgi:hypothetical protein